MNRGRNPSFSCALGIAKEREAPPSAIPAQAGVGFVDGVDRGALGAAGAAAAPHRLLFRRWL
ncbi:MAG: hypothetical protein OXU61_08955 [Gammaproteobacteria bacterium]|nr:hypothetical protein [Gammaproteobacteria bacterium]